MLRAGHGRQGTQLPRDVPTMVSATFSKPCEYSDLVTFSTQVAPREVEPYKRSFCEDPDQAFPRDRSNPQGRSRYQASENPTTSEFPTELPSCTFLQPALLTDDMPARRRRERCVISSSLLLLSLELSHTKVYDP